MFIAPLQPKDFTPTRGMVSPPIKSVNRFRKDVNRANAGMMDQLATTANQVGIRFRPTLLKMDRERTDAAGVESSVSLEKVAKNAIYHKDVLSVLKANGSLAINASTNFGE